MSMVEKVVIGNAELWLGDCLDVLPSLPRVDALITDPPYGINLHKLTGTGRDRIVVRNKPLDVKIVGDDKPFDPAPFLHFPKVILWGGIHFASRLPENRCWLIWDKRDGSTSDNQADCEMAWTNLPGPARLWSQKWRGAIRTGEENVVNGPKLHTAQKPVALLSWCIDQCRLQPGAVILDTHMGSGSMGVSALRAGHKYIGIEIEPKYFDIACKRIEQAQKQGRLFPDDDKTLKHQVDML